MTETTVTSSNPYTPGVQQAFAPLFQILTPKMQHFLTYTHNDELYPEVEFADTNDTIIIRYLPCDITVKDIQEKSCIESVMHRLKNLYINGHQSGRAAAKSALREGRTTENNCMRMYYAYTYTTQIVYDEDETPLYTNLIINFLVSNIKNNPHKFIERIPRSMISDKEIEEYRRANHLVKATRNTVTTWREMTAEEVQQHMRVLIHTGKEELQILLDNAYLKACADGTEPNYLVVPA